MSDKHNFTAPFAKSLHNLMNEISYEMQNYRDVGQVSLLKTYRPTRISHPIKRITKGGEDATRSE